MFSRLFSDIVLFIEESLPISVWISSTTSATSTTVWFYTHSGDVRTTIGTALVSFTSNDGVKRFIVKNAANTREIGFVDIDPAILSSLVGVNILDRKKHVLEKNCFIVNRTDIYLNRSNILVNGFNKRYQQINYAIKDLVIGSKSKVFQPRMHRLYFDGTNRAINIQFINENNSTIIFTYNSSDVPADPSNHVILMNAGDDNWCSVTVDWTQLSTATLTSASVTQDGIPSGTPPYSWVGISEKHIIDTDKVKMYNNILNTKSTNSISGTGVSILSNIVVLGEDAPVWLKIWFESNFPEEAYLISSSEIEVNKFLDSFLGEYETTIQFIGTFTTYKGLNKHPNFNFIGYGATLIMANGANANYERAICPTSGKKSFNESPIISHNNTFVKGFILDGNMAGNSTYNVLYASAISHTIFNSDLVNYTDTQYITDIVLEDIKTKNWKRNGIVAGNGWKGRNITIENSSNDHGLYIAGSGDVFFENITFKGTFANGALSCAGNNKLYQKFKSDMIILRNLVYDEVLGGPHVDIRGKFDNTLYPCNNVLIDGLRIKNSTQYGNVMFTIGSTNTTEPTPTDYSGFSKGIEIRNMYLDVNCSNILFSLNRAQVKLSGVILLKKNRSDRPMFRISGAGDNIFSQYDFRGLDIIFTNSLSNYPVIGLYNNISPVLPINGLKLDGMTIKSPTNDFYLFDLNDKSETSSDFIIKNLSMNNVIANVNQAINPNVISKIEFVKQDLLDEI